MTYGSSVSRAPEREYIQSLSNYISNEGLLNIPPNHQNQKDFWCHQAAVLLREYYIHPSISRPFYKPHAVKTNAQYLKLFEKYVINKCFDNLMKLNWIKQDTKSSLFLLTDDAKLQMEQIANSLINQPVND